MLTLLLVCAFSPRKYKSILRGFYEKGSLPGDCHATLAMTEYFVRNETSVCLQERDSKIHVNALRYSVQRTLCHCERSVAISRKGHLIISLHNDFLFFFGFLELLFPQNVQYHADRRRNYVGYRLAGDYAVNGDQHVQKIHQRNVHNALSYYRQ